MSNHIQEKKNVTTPQFENTGVDEVKSFSVSQFKNTGEAEVKTFNKEAAEKVGLTIPENTNTEKEVK